MNETTGYGYVGRKPCGCIVAAIAEVIGEEKRLAKDVAKLIRGGLTVERVLCEDFRSGKVGPFPCNCKKKA